MAYTKEQRAAKAAAKTESPVEVEKYADHGKIVYTSGAVFASDASKPVAEQKAEKPAAVLMTKDGVETLVNNNESVQIMEGLGWKAC